MSLDSCPVRRADRAVLIVLPEEIDVTNADHVGAELARARDVETEVLVVDMTGTVFCDSAGVQMLVRARHQAAAAGTAVRVAVDARPVRRVLELAGADQVIDTYPDLRAATHGLAVTG